MFTIQWLAQPACRLLTLTLLHFVWQAIAISLFLIVLVELCGIRRSSSRYACSLVALLAIAFAPLATLALLVLNRSSNRLSDVRSLDFSSIAAAPGTSWTAWIEIAQPYLLAVWFTGIVVFGSRLLLGVVGVARLRRQLLPLPNKIAAIVDRLGHRLQIDVKRSVFLSAQVTEAMAIGVIRPLVLLPAAWAAEMPLELLEAVIAHEVAHLRRHDLWVNLVQRIVETLLFYHPAVWWLSRRLRIEREMCADELAVAATGEPLHYAQALEQIAGERRVDIRPALAAFLRGETNMCLLKRIRNILGQPASDSSRMWPVGIVVLSLPLGLWAALAISGVANADDERDSDKKPSVKRDRDERRTDERRVERDRRTDENDREEAIVSRVGDQLIITRKLENPRESIEEQERRTIDRGRQRIEVEVRDWDRGEAGDRRVGGTDGKPMIVLTQRRDEERAGSGDRRMDELTALVKQLAQRVERLQDEVAQLRGQKPPVKRELYREEDVIRDKRNPDQQSELDERKFKLAAEKIEAARKSLAEQEKALAQALAARQAGSEARVRAIKEWAENEVIEKMRAAEEKARAAREKGAAAEREKDAVEREEKERALKELERAKQRKEEAARDKKEVERKELEKKLKELKEGKDSAALEPIDDPQLEIQLRKALIKDQTLGN
jgi:beta-lactamase regulating signal transducer with metallopeptidase domain